MVKEKPERFTRHEGKQVLLPAGALGGQTEQVMIEVDDVYAVVRAKEAEVKKHHAECVWVCMTNFSQVHIAPLTVKALVGN